MYSNVFSIFPPAHAFEVTLPAARNRSAERKASYSRPRTLKRKMSTFNAELRSQGDRVGGKALKLAQIRGAATKTCLTSSKLCAWRRESRLLHSWAQKVLAHLPPDWPIPCNQRCHNRTPFAAGIHLKIKRPTRRLSVSCLLTALMDSDPGHETEW